MTKILYSVYLQQTTLLKCPFTSIHLVCLTYSYFGAGLLDGDGVGSGMELDMPDSDGGTYVICFEFYINIHHKFEKKIYHRS